MHNEKREHSQQLSTRDGELAELKKQLNGVKSIEAQLRSEIEVLNKKIEKSQADQKKECDRLKEKLRETGKSTNWWNFWLIDQRGWKLFMKAYLSSFWFVKSLALMCRCFSYWDLKCPVMDMDN